MAKNNFLNKTVLAYFYNRLKTVFSTKTELNALDTKVDEIIAEGGEPNVIEVVQKNGTALPISNKTVNVEVPTTTSDLTNNSNYQTETQVQALIDSELAGITGIDFQVVQTLPASGVKGTIYLLQNQTSATDVYDEYIWLAPEGGTAHWEQIGTTAVDLSDYWSQTDLVAITTAEIDEIIGA